MQHSSSRLSLLIALPALLLSACEGEEARRPPSDRFFRGVFAGNAGEGSANVIAFDPEVEVARGSASGAVPRGKRALLVELFSSNGPLALTGTWEENGRFEASGSLPGSSASSSSSSSLRAVSYLVKGKLDGDTLTATVIEKTSDDPDDELHSQLTGFDIQAGAATAFCGSYQGDSSGAWNFVVQESGQVTGSYEDGPLSGTAFENDVRLKWTYPSGFFCGSGGGGTATGKLDARQGMSGSWSGSACGDAYAGAWQGAACSSPAPRLLAPSAAECTCASQATSAGPVCCPDGPCCNASTLPVKWN